MSGISRRTLLQTTGITVAATVVAGSIPPAVASASPSARSGSSAFLRGFVQPPVHARPWFRYWIPAATVTPASVAADVNTMADGGWGGLEITDLPQFGAEVTADNRFGSAAWIALIEAALTTAKKRGMEASMLIGPAWPAGVSTITTADEASSKQLAHARMVVGAGATYSGAVPAPTSTENTSLVAVQAFQAATDTVPDSGTVTLAVGSYQDLTSQVSSGQIVWTAPSGGNPWVLIGYWIQPTGQSLEGGTAIVVDHYSKVGAAAVADFWERKVLTSTVRSVIRSIPTSIFEDSIELSAGTHWTPAMLSEFSRRRGYSLLPVLPAALSGVAAGWGQTAKPPYSFDDDTDARVLEDFQQTLSELYLENHTWAIQKWAHRQGLRYKAQAYGGAIDTTLACATIDLPEGESLDDGKHSEKWRVKAGGAHLGGKNILSVEGDATLNNSYGLTWAEDMLPMSNGNYASGVNRGILHGFPTPGGPSAVWPGNDAFQGITTGDNWGPRMPTWNHITDVSGYLSRCQYLLQAGEPKIDVAVYRPGLDIGYGSEQAGIGMWTDPALAAAGYSYDYQSAGSLRTLNPKVRGGVLAPDGPSYRALILFDQVRLHLDIAKLILRYADAGLPILLVGDQPSKVPTYRSAARQDAQLTALVKRLKAHRKVRVVDSQADAPAALRTLGIIPATDFAAASADLASCYRMLRGSKVFFFTNLSTTDTISTDVSLAGQGTPYRLDPFSGAAQAVAVYRQAGSRTSVPLRIRPGDSAVIVLSSAAVLGTPAPRTPAVSSTGDVQFRDGRLTLLATKAGSYQTRLAGGRAVTSKVAAVPGETSLTRWNLSVESWQPGGSATAIDKSTVVKLELSELKPWKELDGLADASGVGTYTTTFDFGTQAGLAAHLDLGAVTDTFRIWVNGKRLPAQNIIDTVVDLDGYLVAGRNVLKVEVASTMRNAVRVARGGQWANFAKQDYGLLGPVTLRPYLKVAL